MTPISDITLIRSLLATDRSWALYALGDLTPGFWEDCRWFRVGADSLVMLYGAFDTPVFFALRDSPELPMLLDTLALPEMYLLAPPDILPTLQERYTLHHLTVMWRMMLNPDTSRSVPTPDASLLTMEDLDALERLYADDTLEEGDRRFFTSTMLETGVYYGIREGKALLAAAGTHLVAPTEGVAALGNVYTRRDRRGQGLATQVVGAVVAELQRRDLPTIGLNVAQNNPSAIHVYKRQGFEITCPFYEAHAIRQENRVQVTNLPDNVNFPGGSNNGACPPDPTTARHFRARRFSGGPERPAA